MGIVSVVVMTLLPLLVMQTPLVLVNPLRVAPTNLVSLLCLPRYSVMIVVLLDGRTK